MRGLALASSFVLAVGCTAVQVAGIAVDLGPKLTIRQKADVTVKAWSRLSAATAGVTLTTKVAVDVPGVIIDVVDRGIPAGEPVDLVFVVDTTGSMRDDIDAVTAEMQRILATLDAKNPDRRVGLVAYRDLGDVYTTKTVLAMSTDDAAIQAAIASLEVDGGGDDPEHVYAGLHAALVEQPWRPHASQHIILMGDAPPHEDYHDDPRTYDAVVALAQTAPRRVRIHGVGITCADC